jgi:fused signal recognition particle receptor
MGLTVGIIVAVIIIAAVGYHILSSKNKDSATSELSEVSGEKISSQDDTDRSASEQDKSAESENADKKETDQDTPAAEEPAAEEPAEPEEEAAEGVRLDETEEQEAEASLKAARRERKLKKLRQGLAKTRGGFIEKIGLLFKGKSEIDPGLLDSLEETLISSDIGTETSEWLLKMVKDALDSDEQKDPEAVWNLIKDEIKRALSVEAEPWDFSKKPFAIMVVGVNGAGKTTTIGKIASQLTQDGKKVVLAAADTFRAAAVNQLEIWGRRTGCDVVKPAKEGADPSSVVFDAMKKAEETGADAVIVDTAGRLHTQAPLMEELKKISRVMTKSIESAPHETLLVLDATTGQNAIAQVKEFGNALDLTSIALTKLDGTAKGGVIIGICHENKIPVRYIGIGETKDSLRSFNAEDFVEALFLQEEVKE